MKRPSFLVFAFAALASGCTSSNPLGGDGGIGGNCTGFGNTPEARRLEAFLTASTQFAQRAENLDTSLREACTRMASDLGISSAELMPAMGQTATQAACGRVAQQLRTELTAIRAEAGVVVSVASEPPRCEVQVSAYSDCMAQCDASFTPGMVPQCEGGEIRGRCEGSCTGSCAAMVSGSCSGACEGTCTGSCTGTCRGRCDGTCSARAADGSCNGTCMGTCEGTCSAGCSGSCMGQCVVMGSGSCSGECRASCEGTFQEPRCTGSVVPPMANADCRASCDARVTAQAECEPGRVRVDLIGTASPMAQARFMAIKTALENNFGTVLATSEEIQRLALAGQAMARVASTIPSAVGSLGVQAAMCATSAAQATTQAVSRVMVSVEVSVEVSGSVSGGTM